MKDSLMPKRLIILDSLRGLALFGISLANFPEFSLYTFQNSQATSDMPTAGIDTVIVSNKKLLVYSLILILLPIAIDACVELFGWNLTTPAIKATEYFHNQAGITERNFPMWLVESQSYPDVLKFNLAGSFIRMQEFIDGNRAFKVFGLFLLGLYIGRTGIYANLQDQQTLLRKLMKFGFIIGFLTSVLYAWSAMNGHPLGLAGHSAIYAISVVPLSLAYISAICLLLHPDAWHLQIRLCSRFSA